MKDANDTARFGQRLRLTDARRAHDASVALQVIPCILTLSQKGSS